MDEEFLNDFVGLKRPQRRVRSKKTSDAHER